MHIHCKLFCITHIFIYIYNFYLFFHLSAVCACDVFGICVLCMYDLCGICVWCVHVCVCEPTYHSICVEVWVPLFRVTFVFFRIGDNESLCCLICLTACSGLAGRGTFGTGLLDMCHIISDGMLVLELHTILPCFPRCYSMSIFWLV